MKIRKLLAATAILTMISGGAIAADGNPDAYLGGANDYNGNLNGQARIQNGWYDDYETYNEIQTRAGNDDRYSAPIGRNCRTEREVRAKIDWNADATRVIIIIEI